MITIVIPAYNEENRLGNTVEAFSKYFPKAEIMIVPNGCTDNTEKVAERLSKRLPNVLTHALAEAGKGRAIHAGFEKAKKGLVGFVDADLAITPEEFEKLIDQAKGFECVVASRWVSGAQVTHREPLKTIILGRIFNLLARLALGITVKDTQCGAKLFRTDFIQKIIPRCVVKDWAVDVELLWRTKRAGGRIKEVPIIWRHEERDSKTKLMRNSWRMFKGCMEMVMNR